MLKIPHMCSEKRESNLRGAAFVRLVITLFCIIIIIINAAGCNAVYRNYANQEVDSAADEEKAKATRGSVNAILLPGCADKPGAQDTLFSCLKLSRDVNPESIKLPMNEKIYLGHVAEFIVRALKHYQMQESFKDFYGCRIILKFRKLAPSEIRSRKFANYSGIVAGTAGTVAGVVTLMPLNIILFLVDGIKTEIDRQEFEDRVTMMGLPLPKKGAFTQKLEEGGRTILYVKDEIGQQLTGKVSTRMQFDDKVSSYIVEECVLEKVTPEELTVYQAQVQRFRNTQ
ncbi:MAG: hypothetical protein CVU52_03650 [Deltaproteobacteria bacterium HGW-Deltaproteobacteria-10]|nr:MAG: hypothetical protein CVU52_03650 [Deltaproteobacteria bacterium HGW-Deltaproteobacteria-10]